MTTPLRTDAKFVMGSFAVSGVIHLVAPKVFEPLMPAWLPNHRQWIIGSGVAELACAAGLALPATRRAAGYASAALLAGVYVGNVKMAGDALKSDKTPLKVAAVARLPLQFPLIRGAVLTGQGK